MLYELSFYCRLFNLFPSHLSLQMSIGTGRRKVRTNTMNAYRRPQQYIHHHCQLCHVSLGCAFVVSVCILMLPVLGLAAEHLQIATDHLNPLDQWHFKTFSHAPLVIPSLNNLLPVMVLQNREMRLNGGCQPSNLSILRFFLGPSAVLPGLSAAVGRRAVGVVVILLLLMSGDIETNPGPLGELLHSPLQ